MCQRGETSGNSKAIYSAACCAQSNDGQIYMYIGVGKFNGWPVK